MGNFFTTIVVICIAFVTMINASLAQSIERIRFGVHPNMTRVVLDINGEASSVAYHVAPSNQSNALLIAFPKEVSWNAPNSMNKFKGAVNGYQFKARTNSGALVISTNTRVKIKRSFTLSKSGKNSARIIFDLVKDLSLKENIKGLPQKNSTLRPQPLKPMGLPSELVQAAQLRPMLREPWLTKWLSTNTAGKASPVRQPAKIARPDKQHQQTGQVPHLPSYFPSPASIDEPLTPTGFNNQRMPVVSNSLGTSYQLPQSAQLDPIQKQAQTRKITEGTYVGTGIGMSFLDQNISSDLDSAKIDGSPRYFKVFAGHRFSRLYSAELFYSNLGKSSSTSNGLKRSEVEVSNVGAAFQFGYPILERLVPFAKVGVVALNKDAKIGSDDVSNWLPRSYLGLGIDCWLTPHIGIRSEYENYAVDNSSVSAAIIYKF